KTDIQVKSAPAPKGGDEKGTWIATKGTAFLSGAAGALVNVNESSAEGKGYVKFDGKRFVVMSDTKMTISTKIAGKMVQAAVTTLGGTYKINNGKMSVNVECTETTAEEQEGQAPKALGWSRISDTEALFTQTSDSPFGEVTIALTLKKAD